MREVKFKSKAYSELQDWVTNNPKLLRRILRIIEECRRTPFEGLGKPEPLKGDYKTCWSRRIDEEHRLVYQVNDEEITILSLFGHYDD